MTTKNQQLRAKMEVRIKDALARFYYEELPGGRYMTPSGNFLYEEGVMYWFGDGRQHLMVSLEENHLKDFSNNTLLALLKGLPDFYQSLKQAQDEHHEEIEKALEAAKEFEKPPGPPDPPRPVADRVG